VSVATPIGPMIAACVANGEPYGYRPAGIYGFDGQGAAAQFTTSLAGECYRYN
jgi:hypothetical protein